jgi:hypothetical protein
MNETKVSNVISVFTNDFAVSTAAEVHINVEGRKVLIFQFDTEKQAYEFANGKPARGIDSVTWDTIK